MGWCLSDVGRTLGSKKHQEKTQACKQGGCHLGKGLLGERCLWSFVWGWKGKRERMDPTSVL